MIILKPAAAAELDLLENTYTGEKSTKRGPLHLYFKENDPSMQSCAVVTELSGRPCSVAFKQTRRRCRYKKPTDCDHHDWRLPGTETRSG